MKIAILASEGAPYAKSGGLGDVMEALPAALSRIEGNEVVLILPYCLSVYNMIVLRTSFNAIPKGLMESATIDGAGDGVILFKIVLPLSLASLATITLFYAVGYWGAWYNAMIYLQKRRDLYPLQLFLRELLILGDCRILCRNSSIVLRYDCILFSVKCHAELMSLA